MTYLDPDQARDTFNWKQWGLRLLVLAAVLALGWFALTLGTENGSVRPEIVQEPGAEAAGQ